MSNIYDKLERAASCPPTVEQRADGWYWADETWSYRGPLPTREEAVAAQSKYCDEELMGQALSAESATRLG